MSEDVEIEVVGLSAYGAHGVSEAEREVGRRIVVDLAFTVPANNATVSDDVADTADYGEAGALVERIVREESCRTLERLATLIADTIEQRFGVTGLEVRVAKPEPPMPQTVDEVAVTLRRGSA